MCPLQAQHTRELFRSSNGVAFAFGLARREGHIIGRRQATFGLGVTAPAFVFVEESLFED